MDSLVNINITEPITELVKVVSNGIGTLYEPRRIRKKAEAEAKALEITERSKTNAEIERRERLSESDIRIQNRLKAQERIRQKNIDDVVDIAANQLKGENEVPKDKVSVDWATRFFNTVQDISEDEMKLIWGKLLAGEVKSPGSYSLRAIELLKNLTPDEALLFTEVSKFAFKRAREIIIIQSDNINNDFGLTFDKILTLTDAGLLKPIIDTAIDLAPLNGAEEVIFTYGNYAVKAIVKSEGQIATYIYTTAGSQIYKLIDNPEVNLDYLRKVLQSISNDNVKFQIYKITKWNDFNDFDIDEKSRIDINVD
jgi:hypothetical protein